jgi:mevalonate kinase
MNILQARGKLLISAEYMVLHGSQALVLPLNKTQSLHKLKSGDRTRFSWNAHHGTDLWFRAEFRASTLEIVATSDREKAEKLQLLLKACMELDPLFQRELQIWDVETRLDFSPEWGFGSSSTLTALMAEWAGVNALDLHFMVSEGSGYDVACAVADHAILYSLREDVPHFEPVSFHPPWADQIHFVWLGSKQSTALHIREIASRLNPASEEVRYFSRLTRDMLGARELQEFRAIMEEHEAKLSELTGQERVSRSRFPGLQGSVKSLGAWGGDFAMIASEQEPDALYNYLDKLGFTRRFRFKDLIYEA